MTDDATIERARYIFSTGKLIHDRILKVQSHYLATCESETAGELSLSQLHMVRVVWETGAITMSELADRMGVSPPSASVMVERLVTKGILSRNQSTDDRRKVLVDISPQAVTRAQAIEASLMQFFVELVETIGPETAQMWCDVLARIKSALSGQAALQEDSSET